MSRFEPLIAQFYASATVALVPAQTDPVRVTPSRAGLPGGQLFQKLLGWLAQIALWGSLASILFGAAIWGLAHSSGYGNGTQNGRKMLLGGIIGAVLVGLAPGMVNEFFNAGKAS